MVYVVVGLIDLGVVCDKTGVIWELYFSFEDVLSTKLLSWPNG